MRVSDTLGELASALAAATAELENVGKGHKAQAGRATYSYANIADVLRECRPVLARHGLSVVAGQDLEDEAVVVVSRLLHKSGEWIETDCRVPVDRQGGIHGVGSAITYARRYALLALIGIAAEDDDGKTAQAAKPKRRAPEPDLDLEPRGRPSMTAVEEGLARDALRRAWASRLRAAQIEFGSDEERAATQRRLFGFDRLEDVPANQCEAKRVKLQSVDDATFERVVTEARLGATLGAVKAGEVARG